MVFFDFDWAPDWAPDRYLQKNGHPKGHECSSGVPRLSATRSPRCRLTQSHTWGDRSYSARWTDKRPLEGEYSADP